MNQHDVEALRIDPEDRRPRHSLLPAILAALAVLAVVVVIAAVALGAFRSPPEVSTARARAVEAGDTAVLTASGYVTARRRATVSARVTGQVEEVLVEEGMRVAEGQILARLDAGDAAAVLAAAEAEFEVARARLRELDVALADARRTLERRRQLHADGVASQEAVDAAETAAERVAAALQVAREESLSAARRAAISRRTVENHVIRAPFAGVVVSKDAQPGEMISPVSAGGGFTRTGIATLVDMESLEIEVDVSEASIARVHEGQAVTAVLDAYPDLRLPARVLAVVPTADRQKATVRVRIALETLDPRVLPDMGVRVSLLEPGAAATAERIVVPRGALRGTPEQPVVLVVGSDAVLERRAVRVAAEHDGMAELAAGVTAGELVVVDGPDGLQAGQRVRLAEDA